MFDLNRFRFFTFIFFIFEYLYTYVVVLYYILTNSWIFLLYIIWIVGSRKSSVNPMQAMLGMNLLSLLRLVASLSHKCFPNIAITNALCNYCMRTTCTQYSDILVIPHLLTHNLLKQEYIAPRLKSSTQNYMIAIMNWLTTVKYQCPSLQFCSFLYHRPGCYWYTIVVFKLRKRNRNCLLFAKRLRGFFWFVLLIWPRCHKTWEFT